MSTRTAAIGKFTYKKLLRYFLQGVLIMAPIAISIWAMVALFNFLDELLPQILGTTRQIAIDTNGDGVLEIKTVKGLPKGIGFGIVVILIIIIGYISSFFVVGRFVDFFESLLERTPGIKFIYTSVKDFFEAFAGDKKKFDKPILVNVFGEEVWMIGFLTNEDMHQFELGAEYVTAYVPQGYNIAGQVYVVKRERIKMLKDVGASDAMKFAVTGGVITIDDDKK
ncbi:MAG: DUF502 domain-containing protein [Terrimonas sp.]|nr:DUF502 domain-containing protein [Terrimonas sp.]